MSAAAEPTQRRPGNSCTGVFFQSRRAFLVKLHGSAQQEAKALSLNPCRGIRFCESRNGSGTVFLVQSELNETQGALQAAQRLSEQLDRKTEAIAALKEEGQKRAPLGFCFPILLSLLHSRPLQRDLFVQCTAICTQC